MNRNEAISKIIFVIPSMSGGGAERVIANLSNYWVERGLAVEILMTSGKEVAYNLDTQIHMTILGDKTYGSIFKAIGRMIRLRSYVKSNRDSAFIGMESATNIYLLLAGAGTGANIIVSERNNPSEYAHKKLRNIVYELFGKKFAFQTRNAASFFDLKRKKVYIIPNPARQGLPRIYEGYRQRAFIAIGRLEPVKNYSLLIDAFSMICKKLENYQLYIYGEGSIREQIEKLIIDRQLQDKVIIKGFCQNVWEDAKNKDIYILTSNSEGMPNALIEAMGMGMACIATDCPIGGPRELIEDRVNGLLVPVEDAKALADAMLELACNEELKDTLRGNAVRIRDRLSIDKICDRWMEAIQG